jgi:hypothetical protein
MKELFLTDFNVLRVNDISNPLIWMFKMKFFFASAVLLPIAALMTSCNILFPSSCVAHKQPDNDKVSLRLIDKNGKFGDNTSIEDNTPLTLDKTDTKPAPNGELDKSGAKVMYYKVVSPKKDYYISTNSLSEGCLLPK